MAKALAPAYVRLGGTAADLLTFKIKPNSKGFRTKRSRNAQPVTRQFTSKKVKGSHCWCSTGFHGEKICEDLESLYYKNRTSFAMTGLDWIKVNT